MEIFVAWIILSVLVGMFASSKGRSGVGYTFLSLFISPLIGLFVVLILSPIEKNIIAKGELKKCPYCKELIKKDSSVCKHCGRDVNIKKNNNSKYNNDLVIEKEFKNSTYFITITNFNSTEVEEIKKNLKSQYESKGYDQVTIDEETIWKLKSSSYPRTYIQLTIKNKEIKIEAYNVQEEPIIIAEKEVHKPLSNGTNQTDKLLELSKMLDKGLITEEEFKKHKEAL